MGQIYVPVDANALDGIMALNGSGIQGGFWLSWQPNGFSGVEWYWGDSYNQVSRWWDNSEHTKYENGPEGLQKYLEDNPGISLPLEPWEDKGKFVLNHGAVLDAAGCLTWL